MMAKENLLFNRFLRLIEKDHQEITERFINDLLKNPDTPAYRGMDISIVYEMGDAIFRDLSKWVLKEFPKQKIEEMYTKIGMDRFDRGIPFSQVAKSLIIQKRHLWLHVMDKLYDDSTAYEEALFLNNRVVLFFDRAIFYMLKGYEDMMRRQYKKI